MRQLSKPSGWQKGISSWVRLAPMTPATMAVSNTGPFGERRPLSRSAAATAAGKRTRASATAVRLVVGFSVTSTMVGRCSLSRCENVMSAADVVHLDLLGGRLDAAQFVPQFAVAIGALEPSTPDHIQQVRVARAGTHRRAQIKSLSGEQAGVELTLGRQPCAAARAAEGLRHGGNEADFAGPIVEAPALRHLAAIILR